MNKILSLTHTNPLVDARILKTYEVVKNFNVPFLAIGINRGYGVGESKQDFSCIDTRSKKYVWKLVEKTSKFRYLRISLMFIVYIEAFTKILIKGYRFKPTVIHVNDWYVLPIAYLIKRSPKTKIIYDAHELESETNGITNDMRKMVNLIEKLCWKKIDFFITVSPSILEWYKSRYNIEKSEIVMNSPQIEEHKHSGEKSLYFRQKFSIPSSSKIFLYLGNLERGRGIHNILEVFSTIDQDNVVVFMGTGSLEIEISEYSTNHLNIFMHKPVTHNQVTDVASSADYGICLIENVSLSNYYCLPNKLFENIFAGLPVITSNFPDMSEIVRKYSVGISADNNSESLRQAVLSMPDHHFEKNCFSVDHLYDLSWSSQAKKLEKTYVQALSGRKN
ncbi:RfaG Glycosyltransferase [Candidatus Nanopelagicaceae bacterium]